MVDKKEEKEKPNKLRQNLLCRLSAFNRIVPSVSIVETGNHFSNAKNGWKCIESRANKTKRVDTLKYVCASGCFRICLTQCNFTQNKANYFSNTIGVYHFLLQHLFFFVDLFAVTERLMEFLFVLWWTHVSHSAIQVLEGKCVSVWMTIMTLLFEVMCLVEKMV